MSFKSRISFISAAPCLLVAILACSSFSHGQNSADSDSTLQSTWIDGDYEVARTIASAQAEKGDSTAQLLLGLLYEYGLGGHRDSTAAIYWLRSSSRTGLNIANMAIADINSSKTSAESGLKALGFTYLKNLSDQTPLHFNIEPFTIGESDSRSKNLLNALRYNRAMALGSKKSWAYSNTASLLEEPTNHQTRNLYDLSQYYKNKALELDDPSSLHQRGLMRKWGVDNTPGAKSAKEYFELATAKGYRESMLELGKLLIKEQSSDDELERGFSLLEQGSKVDPIELEDYAELFHDGEKVKKDMPRALPLYIDAAEKGARHSASETGRFFEFGWGGEKDPAKAEHFYRLSAARGSYWGAYNLGRLGLKNAKTKAQTEEAVRWLEFAARQENMSATMRLANLYKVDSDWVEADLDKRTYWLNWAAHHDHAEAHLALAKDILGKTYWLKDLNIFAEMWDSFSRALALGNYDSLEEMVYVLTRSYGPRFEPHTALKLLETYFDKYPKSKLLSARITMSNFEGITNPKASKELISEYDSEIGGKPSIENFYLIILFPELFENPIDAIKAYTTKRYGDDITSSRYNSLWKQIFLSESIEEVCDLLASDIASRLPTKENENPRYTIQGRKLIRTINPGLGGALRGINFNMSVEVTFQILPSGQVSNITVTQSNHPFASSVISRIVERWKWEPAPDKGAKIMPARITLTYKR